MVLWLFSWRKTVTILIPVILQLHGNILNDYKSALVQVMAWRQIGNNPLPEPMMSQLNDAPIHSPASMS